MIKNNIEFDNHNIGVLGGARGMGYWIAKFLQRNHYNPTLIDIDKKVESIAKRADLPHVYIPNKKFDGLLDSRIFLPYDVLIIAVPLDSIEEAISTCAPLMKAGSLLMDIGSIKSSIINLMVEHTNNKVNVLSIHPLFGPRFDSFAAQTCVVIQPTLKFSIDWYKWWVNLVKTENGTIVDVTAKEHDEIMMIVQVLTHFIVLATGFMLLNKSKVNIGKLAMLRTPPFELITALIGRVYSGNPLLYWGIQRYPFSGDIRKAFIESANELSAILNEGNHEKFTNIYKNVVDRVGKTNLAAFQFNAKKIFEYVAKNREMLYASKGTYTCIENVESKVIHYGYIEDVSSDHITIQSSKRKVNIAMKKAYLLSDEEIFNWAANHLTLTSSHIELTCSKVIKSNAFVFLLSSITGVVDCKIVDIYNGPKVPSGQTKISLIVKTLPKPHCEDWEATAKKRLELFGCNLIRGL